MVDHSGALTASPRPHRPWLAALLSFVFPGLGQAYAGRHQLAAVFALPVALLVLAGLVIGAGFLGDRSNDLLSSTFLAAVLAVNVALLLWRAASIAQAGFERTSPAAQRRAGIVMTIALVLGAVVMHAWIWIVVAQLNTTLDEVFAGGPPAPAGAPAETPEPGETPAPINVPEYRWDGTDRVNVMLLGTDAAEGRENVLTDVIMVVSVDPVARTAVMISVPRDTGFVPLPDGSIYPGGLFPDKVNTLATRAANDPATWCPDLTDRPEACGIRSLQRSIGLYLGIEVHHYALVDMAGFAELIDALGGLELCLEGELVDPEFRGALTSTADDGELRLPAGCHHYDGLEALSYARSRQGWIEMPDGTQEQQTDFHRNERQQRVLIALRNELADADLLFELPDVLRAIGRTVSTDVPRDQAGDLATLGPLITGPSIERVVLGRPDFVDLPVNPQVNYLLVPRRDVIREEMARIFGRDNLVGWYLATADPGPNADPEAGVTTP